MIPESNKKETGYLHTEKINEESAKSNHYMVLFDKNPSSAELIVKARSLAEKSGSDLVALYVEEQLPEKYWHIGQLSKNIKLARQAGAEVISVPGTNLVKEILNVAKQENITHLVIGKSGRFRFHQGFPIYKLIKNSNKINIYIQELTDDGISHSGWNFRIPSVKSGVYQYLLSVLLIGLTALLCSPLSDNPGYHVVSYILLFVVSFMATFMGIGPILLASTLSALVWNYFFIPPHFTFHIDKTEDMLMFGMFFLIAMVNGVLTSRVRKQERLTHDREKRTNTLFQLTKELSKARGIEEVIRISSEQVAKYFDVSLHFILQDGNNHLVIPEMKTDGTVFSAAESEAIRSAYSNSSKTGKYTENYPSGDYTFYSLEGTMLKPGVIAVKLKKSFSGEREAFWETFITQISNSLEREFLVEIAQKAKFLDESDRLYKTLFNSISHELRIPVATIIGASDALLTSNHSGNIQTALCNEIFAASTRLNRLIENLLNMSRLESGRLTLRPDWYDIHDLVNKVIENLHDELKPFYVSTEINDDLPLVRIDFGLMEQVLYNLVYNATIYAPAASEILIRALYTEGNLILEVLDQGPGFPQDKIKNVFNKFFRVDVTRTGGLGLGLSIVKGFVEAHNGTVAVENRNIKGARFIIRVPSGTPDIDSLSIEKQ